MKTGIDITFCDRFSEKLNKKSFLDRIFTVNEQKHIFALKTREGALERLAGKFCAKEAVSKALGTGIADGVNFLDIEILPNQQNKPVVTLYGGAREKFIEQNLTELEISISHDGGMAISICVMI